MGRRPPAIEDNLQRNAPLSRYTTARVGGPADYLFVARSRDDLCAAARFAREKRLPFLVLGAGANVLFDDAGFRGLVVVNRARNLHIDKIKGSARAESGVSLSGLARQCIEQGLSGLEWATGIPGTLGGAVINNAGAHGGDMAGVVRAVDVLTPEGREQTWPAEAMAYAYRESRLKRSRGYVVLGAALGLGHEEPETLRARAREFAGRRKATQPPGASLGSMFKNPPGDYAGRLIDAAGLRGERAGGVVISPLHANFFVNEGGGDTATAADYRALIEKARAAVREQFGVELELEIEIIGEDG